MTRLVAPLILVVVALNLRPAVTDLAPVLPEIMRDINLDAAGASLLATAPVLCLGVFGALAPAAVRVLGLERALLGVLAAITIGCALRGTGTILGLAIGGILAGGAIGIGNVVMPSFLKRDFSRHAAPMTGLYTMALSLGAAAGSGLTAPLRELIGGSWALALALWGVPAFAALTITAWAWRGRYPKIRAWAVQGKAGAGRRRLLGDPLAWQVTLFMGLQSVIAWSVLGWLAPILRARGDDPVTAGLVVAVAIAAQIGSALPTPILAARSRRQSFPAFLGIATTVAGVLGLLWAPLSWQWALGTLLGLGMGASLALAMMITILRAPDAASAARLSGMAQSIGYSLAAAGPFLVGVFHDATGDWSGMAFLCALCGIGAAMAGAFAGRDRLLRAAPDPVL